MYLKILLKSESLLKRHLVTASLQVAIELNYVSWIEWKQTVWKHVEEIDFHRENQN